ncbi:hypothetical protein Daus18300_005088 [Diaporthe australafricana]|uniref:Alpha-L-rhamnosidase six-hairpin glycosidase domain-containing protein n=1 Tax=Diaporthe australafricana TaxID=127596 RepID=A0ABR3X4B0_9PEZI
MAALDLNLDTDQSWKTRKDTAACLVPDEDWDYRLGPQFLSLNENVDGRMLQNGWLLADFDDNTWAAAIPATPQRKMSPMVDPWRLFPRSIPYLPERTTRFDGVVRCSDPTLAEAWKQLLSGDAAISIPASSPHWVDIETSELTTGFLDLCMTSNEADSTTSAPRIEILCSECYEAPMEAVTSRTKRDRTDSENGTLYGMKDTYTLHEGSNHYSPFWFRTFRYIRLTISTAGLSAPVSVDSFTFRKTHYPLDIRTKIQTSDPLTRKLWDISVNTLRNCMHETYEDCPFYEQNQFAMDTRSMILFTYLLSRDDRLARKAMQEFYATRREDGLIETHSPCPGRATNIPTFSLFWVLMVWDHMVYFGDEVLVRSYLGAVDGVLDYFHQRVNPATGLVGQFDEDTWAFVDWADGWATPAKGFFGLAVPPAYYKTGSATYHSLIYAYVLAKAGELCQFVGRHDTAKEYVARRDGIIEAVKRHCFDEETGFFLDGPGTNGEISQHCQVFAVLADCVSGEEAKALLRKSILHREKYGLVKTSFALGFYVFRAVSLAGVYEECWATLIQTWEKMIADKLTTWAESESMMRSDCHGWSASPVWEIGTEIVGVKFKSQGYVDRVLNRGAVGVQEKDQSGVEVVPRTSLVRGHISADVLTGDGVDDLVHVEISEGMKEATVFGGGQKLS